MMRIAWSGLVVFGALFATQGCSTPSPDWNGTWKLNPAKSSYKGKVLTISISADGEYRFDENSSYTLRCDGKDQPIGNNRTRVCVKSGVTALDITLKENGVKTRTTRDELSADGKVLTATATAFHPDGSTTTSQINFSRLSGSNGFAGQWRDANYLQQHADMTLRLDNQALHIDYPNAGQQIDAPLNGVDAAVHGPRIPEGETFAVQAAEKYKFLKLNYKFVTLTKRNGKVLNQGSLELSDDGRTITDSWWNPDQPNDTATLVYEKK